MTKHTYGFKIFNGRCKVYVDGYVMFTFNQIDFKGYYSYKDDTLLYGIDIYLMNEKGGQRRWKFISKPKRIGWESSSYSTKIYDYHQRSIQNKMASGN